MAGPLTVGFRPRACRRPLRRQRPALAGRSRWRRRWVRRRCFRRLRSRPSNGR